MDKQPSTNTETTFIPPRHWIGPEELEASYWSNPEIQERRSQEFHDKPIETLEMIEKLDTKGIARRDFLTIMGASMAMASLSCARRPVHKIIPYVVKPEEIIPGVPNWYASTDPDTGLGLLVKNREGRPIKMEGNPDHPVNSGKLHARTQAAVLDLYDVDRLKEPLAGNRQDGSRKAVAWSEADAAIAGKLQKASKVRVLTGAVHGESTRRLLKEFTGSFRAGEHVEYEPLNWEDIVEASEEAYGTAVLPTYDFSKAELIVSLGADFLGTWTSPVEHAAQWAKNRKLDSKKASSAKLSKLVTFEPNFTITGASSDERFPVRPGDELKIAMAIAYELLMVRKFSSYAGNSQITSIVQGYKTETVAQEIWKDPAISSAATAAIKQLGKELAEKRGKSLVVAGGLASRTANALSLQIATNFLNTILDNEGNTVDGTLAPVIRPSAGFAGMAKLIQDMKAGEVEVLIVHHANPGYTLGKAVGFEEALSKVPFIVVISDKDDETAWHADYILADHHFLENWGDGRIRKNVYSLQQPVIAPLHSTRSLQDSLLTWIRAAKLPASGLAATIAKAPDTSNKWYDYLKATWHEVHREVGSATNFDLFWEGALREGVVNLARAKGLPHSKASPRSFRAACFSKVPAYKADADSGLTLALYPKISMGDGRSANNPWLQEMPDPVSTATWDNYLNMGPATAKKMGIGQDDVVTVSADGVSVELPVNIQPGLHAGVVSAAIGYGRKKAGNVAKEAGWDVFPFLKVVNGRLVSSGTPVKVTKTGKFFKIATTQWHNATEGRPVVNDITLATFKKNPAAHNETEPELRMETVPTIWTKHEYKGYRWGMSIDLNSCTGCGACVVACQAENNVPVVGRKNVRVSREMHWIRIDRYYSGNSERPDVVFQPMLCQHCENAPCETVCPVLATVHSPEGLNEQVYNRCVGTRYCQNNCPYKVRRFNFFDHWKAFAGNMNLAWNPDVTVRTRGIMEKCSFCVQRIRDAKERVKDAGDRVKDSDIKTACQQTCPTDAIVFGDINNPESRVSHLREDERTYRVLEVLNVKPSVSYLTKVRNKEGGEGEHLAQKETSGHVTR